MKKLTILLLLSFLLCTFAFANPKGTEGEETGTTTNDTIAVSKTFYLIRGDDLSLFLTNAGTNTLNYQFVRYVSESGKSYIWSSDSLQTLENVAMTVDDLYYKIIVNVESTADGSHTTYELDWAQGEK